jgi:coenzyme F420-reducing hydrogenase alpha subunit
MANDGALTVAVSVVADEVVEVDVRSTRCTDFSRLLVGLEVDAALALVPSLFSICAAAQGVAGLEACEAALGLEVDHHQRALRRTLTALEALDNHCFQFFVEWPRLSGANPLVAQFKAVRAAIDVVRRSMVAGPWVVLGGVAAQHPSGLEPLRAALEAVAPLHAELEAFEGWAAQSPLFTAARTADAHQRGAVHTPLVPLLEPTWFAHRLTDHDFSARPSLDGQPAESGALSFVQSTPLVAAVLAREGRTSWARLVARFADVARLLDLVTDGVAEAAGAKAGPRATRADGAGAGVADTSRGRLGHAVRLENRRVAAWRTVAPTEWSFHPAGVVREALLGQEAEGVEARARLLVAALDPCVACAVTVAR